MGDLRATALAIVFGFFLFTMYAGAMYNGSSDVNRTQLTYYNQTYNLNDTGAPNVSVNDTGNPMDNMNLMIQNMNQKLFEAQQQINSQNPVTALLGYFGLLASLTIGLTQILVMIFIDGINFITGMLLPANIGLIPAPWNYIIIYIGILGTIAFAVYVGIAIFNSLAGRNA